MVSMRRSPVFLYQTSRYADGVDSAIRDIVQEYSGPLLPRCSALELAVSGDFSLVGQICLTDNALPKHESAADVLS